MDLAFLGALLSIVVIDLVLSGDNAVVIGMAASRLPEAERRRAIVFGGAGAIGLRLFFTALAVLLLAVPLLQATGAALLFWIAFKLLKPLELDDVHVGSATSLLEALQTIVLADVVMSLDNILAVGGAAHGSIGLLAFGLALSIPILLFGSSLIARMIHRYPVLNYIGAGVLVVTATRMFLHDAIIHEHLAVATMGQVTLITAAVTIVLGISYLRNRRAQERLIREANRRLRHDQKRVG